jgi:hypothetical protein
MLGRKDVDAPADAAPTPALTREQIREKAIADCCASYGVKYMLCIGEATRLGHDGRRDRSGSYTWSEQSCEIFVECSRSGALTSRRSWGRFESRPNVLVPFFEPASDEPSETVDDQPILIRSARSLHANDGNSPDLIEDAAPVSAVSW